MRKPVFITFTGADDHTCDEGMHVISQRYPVEWGILFSKSRQGVDPRYPGGDAQSRFLWSGLRMSAHFCGEYSRSIMAREHFHGPVDISYFTRIQVNHDAPDPQAIIHFKSGWGKIRCIAQTTAVEFPKDTSIDWLCDASGGRGIRPTAWPVHPGGGRMVGYAGGFNPANVRDVIAVLNRDGCAEGPYWIDMESGVRTNNIFDLKKCLRVCEEVYGELR